MTAKALHGADLSFHLLESKLLFSSRSEEDEEKEFDMLVYLKECEDFCLGRRAGEEAKKGEFAVIGTRDVADLIQAALVHSKRVKDAGIELRGPDRSRKASWDLAANHCRTGPRDWSEVEFQLAQMLIFIREISYIPN